MPLPSRVIAYVPLGNRDFDVAQLQGGHEEPDIGQHTGAGAVVRRGRTSRTWPQRSASVTKRSPKLRKLSKPTNGILEGTQERRSSYLGQPHPKEFSLGWVGEVEQSQQDSFQS